MASIVFESQHLACALSSQILKGWPEKGKDE